MHQLRRGHRTKRYREDELHTLPNRPLPGQHGPDKLRHMRRWVLDGGSDFGSDSVHDMPRGLLQPRPRDVVLGVPHRNVLGRGGVVLHGMRIGNLQRQEEPEQLQGVRGWKSAAVEEFNIMF